MAYATGVRDTSRALFDALLQRGAAGLELPEGGNEAGLHLTHEVVLHRPIRAGERLLTRGRLLALERRSRGIFATCALSTVTPGGEAVVDTREGILYLDATLEGELGGNQPSSPPSPTFRCSQSPASRSRCPMRSSTASARGSTTRCTPTSASHARSACPMGRCFTARRRWL